MTCGSALVAGAYRCLHVPLGAVSPLARLARWWPVWLIVAAAVALTVHRWGPWVLAVPILAVLAVGLAVLARDFEAARRVAARQAARVPVNQAGAAVAVAGGAVALPATVRTVCIGCRGRVAESWLILTPDLHLPVCSPCGDRGRAWLESLLSQTPPAIPSCSVGTVCHSATSDVWANVSGEEIS